MGLTRVHVSSGLEIPVQVAYLFAGRRIVIACHRLAICPSPSAGAKDLTPVRLKEVEP